MHRLSALLFASVLLTACTNDDKTSSETVSTDSQTTVQTVAPTDETTNPPTTDTAAAEAEQAAQLVAQRPYQTYVPASYDAATEMPLVLGLHGFMSNSTDLQNYLQFEPLADQYGFLYALPDGTKNADGDEFWNATDACCGGDSTVDDSTYLRAVIDDMKAKYNVDPKRVYIVGFSNGGFMAYRMACDHADAIAAIISIGAATFDNPADCAPSEPVSILDVHGNADNTINIGGGTFMGTSPYPAQDYTAYYWALYDGCPGDGIDYVDTGDYDMDPNLGGAETNVRVYGPCAANTSVETWLVKGGAHAPTLLTSTTDTFVKFLFAHPKA